jgi:hypothetical protein
MLWRAALGGLLVTLALAPAALADGDPASDVLAPPGVRVYMTVAATDPQLEQQLVKTAREITAAGLPIKVVLISNGFDLGAVPLFWGKPQLYARFLGAELRLVYKGTLLIVMPQGFGIHGPYPKAKAMAAFADIGAPKDRSAEALTAAADSAMRALAAENGNSSDGGGGGGGSAGGGIASLIAAGALVLACIGGAALVLRRRRA